MATKLQRLSAEYYATRKLDEALSKTESLDETDLIGLEARVMRRKEILSAIVADCDATDNRSRQIRLIALRNETHLLHRENKLYWRHRKHAREEIVEYLRRQERLDRVRLEMTKLERMKLLYRFELK
jgi:hypothetical protein